MQGDETRQRLDKWLWHVRLQPTRSKSAAFIREGFARLNGARVTDPAKMIRCGDVLTLALHNRTSVVRVLSLPPRRGPANLTPLWYETLGDSAG